MSQMQLYHFSKSTHVIILSYVIPNLRDIVENKLLGNCDM